MRTIQQLIGDERADWAHVPDDAFKVVSATTTEFYTCIVYVVTTERLRQTRMAASFRDGGGFSQIVAKDPVAP